MSKGSIPYGFRKIPVGWSAVGTSGRREDCLEWIQANWTDMRPKSLIEVHSGSNRVDRN